MTVEHWINSAAVQVPPYRESLTALSPTHGGVSGARKPCAVSFSLMTVPTYVLEKALTVSCSQ